MPDLNEIARRSAEKVCGGLAIVAEALIGGTSGSVFRVWLEGGRWSEAVVKLTRPQPEAGIADEPAETRVYGSRASNLMPAALALGEAGAVVPTFMMTWEEGGWRRLVMEALPGQDLRDALSKGDASDLEDLHGQAGDLLGRLHAVTRPHQGWIDAPRVGSGWRAEFLEVFALHLKRLQAMNLVAPGDLDRLNGKAAVWAEAFVDPPAFVLSHTDGVQAMALYDGRWTITGLVDIEDYQFTDPRMALAGHELAVEFHGRSVPDAFWEAYRAHTPVAEGFEALRPMFQAFYLTVWARVLRDDPSARDRCLALLFAEG